MDVLYFLKERTQFIRDFHARAAEPFRTTITAIENDAPPYDDPPYSEDGEPPYLEEWIAADEALEVLGRACVSMLAASLHVYLATWEKELGIVWGNPKEKREAFKQGYLNGYRYCFEEILKTPWAQAPADLEIIEQVVLARNRDQHPDRIDTLRVDHSPKDRAKYPRPFFMSESDKAMLEDADASSSFWLQPAVHVSAEALSTAIQQIEALAEWLEPQMFATKYPGSRQSD